MPYFCLCVVMINVRILYHDSLICGTDKRKFPGKPGQNKCSWDYNLLLSRPI